MNETPGCPNCGNELVSGYIGFYTGLWWHPVRLYGLARVFLSAIARGERLAGHWTSPGIVRMVEGLRCQACGTVVLMP